MRPEEVLFRRLNAPTRYEESDFYFANELLPSERPLPSSEMLEAIHAYSADFYERATVDRGQDDFQSLDETALLAMGILLEEMVKETLGETGDLVLVEGEEISDDDRNLTSWRHRSVVGRKRTNASLNGRLASSGDELGSMRQKKTKKRRRRLTRKTSTTDLDTAAAE